MVVENLSVVHIQGEAMVVYEDDAAANAAIEWFNGTWCALFRNTSH